MTNQDTRVLVTGGGGFIGSHLVRGLLEEGYRVRAIDNFSSGHRANLAGVEGDVEVVEGDICNSNVLTRAFRGVDYCLHQAAIPSVPRSIESPWHTNRVNVEGSLNVFLAARAAGIRRVVYASSSSVYGNVPEGFISESRPRAPFSPYGISKATAEQYAEAFSQLYDMDIVGLRYFNVFGPRQDPSSQYSAVVPLFISRLLGGEKPFIHGDGEQSRDFSYVKNVVRGNLLAMRAPGTVEGVYNIACGRTTTVNGLVDTLNDLMGLRVEPEYDPERRGDIRYSCADISLASEVLGYEPVVHLREGLEKTIAWYRDQELA